MQITKDDSGAVLKIEGTLDISVAQRLQEALLESIQANSNLILELSGIDGCDTTALQLLYAVRKMAERFGKNLELRGISPAIATTSTAIGLPIAELTGGGADGL